ncbi:MAG: TPM domain-containing protein [Bacteroidota bacterium]
MSEQFFSKTEQDSIVSAIQKAELNTSGEIRVHLEPNCEIDAVERAKQVFEELNMHATELKNGVLFYLAYTDKKFAIIGDSGIHEKVSDAFWNEEKEILQTHFKNKQFTEGLCLGIAKAGEKLQQYFPYQSNDTNELSNDISFGGNNNEK